MVAFYKLVFRTTYSHKSHRGEDGKEDASKDGHKHVQRDATCKQIANVCRHASETQTILFEAWPPRPFGAARNDVRLIKFITKHNRGVENNGWAWQKALHDLCLM